MKSNRTLLYLLIAGAAAVWMANFYTVALLIAPPREAIEKRCRKENDALAKAVEIADSALKCRPRFSPFRYNGNFESPFKLFSEAFAPPVKAKKGPLPKINLVLRGVLLKEKPLAILEDEAGKTSILGIGETIRDNVIESIEPSSVKLRGSQGTYTLSVKE